MSGDRIIDQDINTYTATVETHAAILRRCHPKHEPHARAMLIAATAVLLALRQYRDAIDAAKAAETPLALEP